MAVQMGLYSRAQQEKAMRLVAVADKWAEGTRPSDGLRFNLFASESAPGVVYQTHINGLGCTCPGAARSYRGRCYHMLAAAIVTDRAREAATPKAALARLNDLLDRQLVDAF